MRHFLNTRFPAMAVATVDRTKLGDQGIFDLKLANTVSKTHVPMDIVLEVQKRLKLEHVSSSLRFAAIRCDSLRILSSPTACFWLRLEPVLRSAIPRLPHLPASLEGQLGSRDVHAGYGQTSGVLQGEAVEAFGER
jgi:hypothetical protein